MSEEIRKAMMASYYDGGVSVPQRMELGNKRPEIADFLQFSSKYEGVPFRSLWTFGGLEFVFAYEEDFKKIGVSGHSLASCVDGDSDAIREVSRQILASLSDAKALADSGETQISSRGLAVNLAAAKAFVLAALDAKERYQIDEIVPELYFLLSQILFPGEPEVQTSAASKELKYHASYIAWAYNQKHQKYPSYRWLAKLLNVAPSTISRLFVSRDEFEASAKVYETFGQDPRRLANLERIYPHL